MLFATKERVTIALTERIPWKDAETWRNAEIAANRNGKTMGTAKVIFDKEFIERISDSVVFIHWNDTPTKVGWYKVNRETRTFELMAAWQERNFDRDREGNLTLGSDQERQDLDRLEWHEKLYVNKTALKAIEEKRPLTLSVYHADNYVDHYLELGGDYSGIVGVRAAQVELNHEAAAPRMVKVLATVLSLMRG
jgi:hypothetical protein